MQIEFNIANSSLAKLQAIMGGAGGKGASQSGGLTGGKGMLTMITKLSGIALGVIGLVALVKKVSSMLVDSSPILKTMLRIFNTAIMFILRPIGDFIGFFLRPLMIYFLRTIALPFYKDTMPILRKLGAILGSQLLTGLTTGWDTKQGGKSGWEEGFGMEDAGRNLASNIHLIIDLIYFVGGEAGKGIKTLLEKINLFGETISPQIKKFKEDVDGVLTYIFSLNGLVKGIVTEITRPLALFIGAINTIYHGTLLPLVNVLSGLTFPDLEKIITDAIASWTIPDVGKMITDFILDRLADPLGWNNTPTDPSQGNPVQEIKLILDVNSDGVIDFADLEDTVSGLINRLSRGTH